MLGYPALPIVGRYGGAGYELNETLIVMAYPCVMEKGGVFCEGQQVRLPQRVQEVLMTIPEMIVHNKPPKRKDNGKKGKGGERL